MNRDLLIPLRDGGNEELRYALRSFHVNHPPHWVITAGGRPDWLTGTGHLPIEQAPNQPHRNTIRNLRMLLAEAGTDEVIVSNDDMYVVEPLDDLPRLHRGSLLDHAAGRDPHSIAARQAHDTLRVLAGWDIHDPKLYDLHVPAVYDRRLLAETLDVIAERMQGRPTHRIAQVLWATVYGNLHQVGGELADNVKVYTTAPVVIGPAPFLSTNDDTFQHGAVGEHLRSLFPDPSPYER